MKYLLFFFASLVTCVSFSQVQNGSFENGNTPDLSHWEWICDAQSFNGAPSGGGNWSIEVTGGNPQACYPGYAYQRIPSITNGQTFILSGWAYAVTSPTVGIYFGTINYGVITLQTGITTSAITWAPLSVQSSFALSTNDTAIVLLDGGFTGGPQQGFGYFDLIDLQLVTGINTTEQKQSVSIYPNPFSEYTILHSDKILKDASLTVYDAIGQQVKREEHLAGNQIIFQRDGLPKSIYCFCLTQEHQTIASGKFVIADN